MTNSKIPHINALDGLRGTASLMIMFFHFNWQPLSPVLSKVAVFGQTGVDLFFVLSGFLITRILILTKGQKNYFANFYIRRALRIFPLYYGFLIATYFILPLFKIGHTPPVSYQAWYYLYLQDVPITFTNLKSSGPGHLWSLAVEEHFYLIWPLLVYFLPTINLMWTCFGIILLSLVIRIILVNLEVGVFFFTPCRFDALSIGSLLACLEYRDQLFFCRKYFLKIGIFSFILLSVSWLFTSNQHIDSVQIIKFTLIAIFYFCVVGYLVNQKSPNLISRVVENRFLVFTGKISYGLYVFHPLVYNLVGDRKLNLYLTIVLCVSLTYLTAYLSYEVYEKFFLSFKRYFRYI
jgi:peptidoglycan/LPS O-acetylase OafA/YrhL